MTVELMNRVYDIIAAEGIIKREDIRVGYWSEKESHNIRIFYASLEDFWLNNSYNSKRKVLTIKDIMSDEEYTEYLLKGGCSEVKFTVKCQHQESNL